MGTIWRSSSSITPVPCAFFTWISRRDCAGSPAMMKLATSPSSGPESARSASGRGGGSPRPPRQDEAGALALFGAGVGAQGVGRQGRRAGAHAQGFDVVVATGDAPIGGARQQALLAVLGDAIDALGRVAVFEAVEAVHLVPFARHRLCAVGAHPALAALLPDPPAAVIMLFAVFDALEATGLAFLARAGDQAPHAVLRDPGEAAGLVHAMTAEGAGLLIARRDYHRAERVEVPVALALAQAEQAAALLAQFVMHGRHAPAALVDVDHAITPGPAHHPQFARGGGGVGEGEGKHAHKTPPPPRVRPAASPSAAPGAPRP